MEPYRHRIFVCTNLKDEGKSCCQRRGSKETLDALNREIEAKGMKFDVKVVASGCLGLCEQGPNLIVYPEGKWYSGLTKEHVKDFVAALIERKNYVPCAWEDSKLQDFFDKKNARKKTEAS